MLWFGPKIGRRQHTTKLGYEAYQVNDLQETKQQWGKIWKVKDPMNTKLFMWLFLTNKVLLQQMLQKRKKERPSICLLCKQGVDTTHLFIDCTFVKQIWRDMGIWLDMPNILMEAYVEEYLKAQFERKELKICRTLPFLVLWGVWLE